MDRRRILVCASAVQLAAGLAGLAIAARRGQPADPVGLHLNVPHEHIVRSSTILGTAQSAPLAMMAPQAWAILRLLRGDNPSAARTLGRLGATMVGGYLVERGSPLWPGHRDLIATPVYLVGVAGAVAMAWFGLRQGADRDDAP